MKSVAFTKMFFVLSIKSAGRFCAALILSSCASFLTGCAKDGPSLTLPVLNSTPSAESSSQTLEALSLQKVGAPANRVASQTPPTVSSPPTESSAESAADLSSADPRLEETPGVNADKRVPEIPLHTLAQFAVHQAEVNAMVVTRDGSRAYTGGSDGSVICSSIIKADLQNKQGRALGSLSVQKIVQGKKPILALALSPDERFLAATQFSAVFVVDLQTGDVVRSLTRVTGRLTSLAWDPRGEILLIGRSTGEIYGWQMSGTRDAGKNSLRAVEQYGSAGGSPVIRIEFHPSARAFISGEQDGRLSIWRLLRTERELGLRDESAQVDQRKIGSKRVDIGRTTSRLEDLWFDRDALDVYASSADGRVMVWQLRGLESRDGLEVGTDSSISIQGMKFRSGEGQRSFLFSTGRGQKLKVFCLNQKPDTAAALGSVPVLTEKGVEDNTVDSSRETQIVDGRLVVAEDAPPAPPPAAASHERPLAESSTFREPLSLVRSAPGSAVLWAAQKNGNLLVFDARPYLSTVSGLCPRR